MNQAEKRVDYRLWHVLAGDTIHMPFPNSYAYYFPQGHVEHTQTDVDFGDIPRVPSIFCKVIDVKLPADLELEEVYAKIMLIPQDASSISPNQLLDTRVVPKIQYYAKSLNASDLKNFHVPLDGVDMFPKMDYSASAQSRKNLVKGNSVVFTRAENGELFVGLRRGEGRGKARPEDVIRAVSSAVNGQPFEITYYPRASTPEFVVKSSIVNEAMLVNWYAGMRVILKTEGSSLASPFMGTVSSVGNADPLYWLNSLWRCLQVNWDEEREQLQNVQRLSPWLVQPTDIPAIEFNNTHQVQLNLFPKHPDDLTLGSSSSSSKKNNKGSIRLFGRQIHTDQHSSGNKGKEIDGMASSGDCEVFLGSETVRLGTLDLSVTKWYEEVEKKLENLLGDKKLGDSTSVTYDDSAAGVGEEIFSELAKKAKKLTVKEISNDL
ncbi:auxin response factor 16-like [Bidens hawaiensis]|uniref:auxin response factor 16-like n=1 Tax=Bidens hawaiensis TaxID=980011 RepID=UPI00404960E6